VAVAVELPAVGVQVLFNLSADDKLPPGVVEFGGLTLETLGADGTLGAGLALSAVDTSGAGNTGSTRSTPLTRPTSLTISTSSTLNTLSTLSAHRTSRSISTVHTRLTLRTSFTIVTLAARLTRPTRLANTTSFAGLTSGTSGAGGTLATGSTSGTGGASRAGGAHVAGAAVVTRGAGGAGGAMGTLPAVGGVLAVDALLTGVTWGTSVTGHTWVAGLTGGTSGTGLTGLTNGTWATWETDHTDLAGPLLVADTLAGLVAHLETDLGGAGVAHLVHAVVTKVVPASAVVATPVVGPVLGVPEVHGLVAADLVAGGDVRGEELVVGAAHEAVLGGDAKVGDGVDEHLDGHFPEDVGLLVDLGAVAGGVARVGDDHDDFPSFRFVVLEGLDGGFETVGEVVTVAERRVFEVGEVLLEGVEGVLVEELVLLVVHGVDFLGLARVADDGESEVVAAAVGPVQSLSGDVVGDFFDLVAVVLNTSGGVEEDDHIDVAWLGAGFLTWAGTFAVGQFGQVD